ncbi:pirin family protein [Litoribrevibacter albus]|uniref:Quercetin 2,3-dioxygenase n=1 Tax=Litoribrevibacter albus TaxID=1473156 RepID=A0AA37W8D0_9GAMM|nr:pirin family protein [Litoribrevibacter albus]GLQ31331.1 putative quercetin 2,3-dioxygenase [Litoribrevibacter albus]
MSKLQVFQARSASDGAGVKINRVSHMTNPTIMDPFLMLDEIYSDQAEDYIEGFPPHPHRGFETVTVMLKGQMRHQDHLGNNGLIGSGGGQWMTTGRGVIHSEMPEQDDGLLHGFQLWLNLPAKDKLQPARYKDMQAGDWFETELDGLTIRGLGGTLVINGHTFQAPIDSGKTQASVFTLAGRSGDELEVSHPNNQKFFVYVYQGAIQVQDTTYQRGSLLILDDTKQVNLAMTEDSGLLVLSGQPLNEPVAQYGPFVMNTMDEVEQALRDYRNDNFV